MVGNIEAFHHFIKATGSNARFFASNVAVDISWNGLWESDPQAVIYSEGGAIGTVTSSEINNSRRAVKIGATGTNAQIAIMSTSYAGNWRNIEVNSSTGTVYNTGGFIASQDGI